MTAKVKVKKEKKERKLTKKLTSATKRVASVRIIKKPLGVLAKIGGYFKGSWSELRQVRWPNRRATWGLVLAFLLFGGFFVVLIVLLDAGFKELFNLILK